MKEVPVINGESCTGCGNCVSVCSNHSLVLVDRVISFSRTTKECDWCTLCEAVCPTGAISCPFEIVFGEKQ